MRKEKFLNHFKLHRIENLSVLHPGGKRLREGYTQRDWEFCPCWWSATWKKLRIESREASVQKREQSDSPTKPLG